MSRNPSNNQHPWAHLESSLGILLGTSSGDQENAASSIRGQLVRTAWAILSSMRLKGADCDPEAVAHDILVVMLVVGLTGYDPAKGPLHRYWYSAIKNLCVAIARQRIRRRMGHLEYDVAGLEASPAKNAADRALQRAVRAAVARLPKAERVALKLSYRRGRSAKAIGVRCGMHPSTVNVRIHRGKARIEPILASIYRQYCRHSQDD